MCVLRIYEQNQVKRTKFRVTEIVLHQSNEIDINKMNKNQINNLT